MKRYTLSFLLTALVSTACFGQLFSLNDTTITFKNHAGKILTRDDVKELMKKKHSIRQESVQDRKIITIIPSPDSTGSTLELITIAFRAGLIDKPVKQFGFTDINGNKWNTDALKGKAVVINFWFTSCKPCIQEIPHLNKLVAVNQEKPVVFIAPAPEDEPQIKKFLKKYSFDYNIIPAALDYINSTGIENFPTHLVIDKEGIARQAFIGYADDIKEKLQAEIDKLIK